MAAGTDSDVTVVPLSEEASFYEEDLDAPSVSVSSNCSMIINMHTVPCSTSVASNCTLNSTELESSSVILFLLGTT